MSLDAFFAPRSVAVLGASAAPGKLGHALLKNVIDYGYTGSIYPVNPRGGRICGLEAATGIKELAGRVDLALISIPNVEVPAAIRDCAAAGVQAAVILSSGFGETGQDGQAVQAEMRAAARAAGMRVIGPNCMGVYNPGGRLNGSYFWSLPTQVGGVSFVSQSGAMGGLFFADAGSRGLGVAKFASVGNTADVDHADLLEYLGEDPATTTIGLFIEGVKDGARFMEVARRVAARKPVVALKGGRTGAGARASASHTGSLAGAERVYRAALEACGILWTQTAEEFFDSLAALDNQGRRLPKGDGLAVITISGGPSVLAADHCEGRNLSVPALAPATQTALRKLTPDFAAVSNPVDLTPQVAPAQIPAAIDAILADPAVGGGLFINLGLDFPEFATGLTVAQEQYGKPIVSLVTSAPGIQAALAAASIPNYSSPERAVDGYHALVRRGPLQRRAAAPLPPAMRPLAAPLTKPLNEHEAKALLARYGLPVTAEELVDSLPAALAAGERLGFPVALKVCRADLLHKTEAGGIRLRLQDGAALRAAYADLTERFGAGPYLVQPMAPPGIELIVGAKWDPTFGQMVAFGLGGVYVELLGEVSLAPAPISLAEAQALVARSKAARLLGGYRGGAAVDLSAVAECLVAVSNCVSAHPEIAEVDVNPLIAGPGGLVAVDAAMVLRIDVDAE